MDERGIRAADLSDGDLERELHHLYETRAETFFRGTEHALEAHTQRMLELEREYEERFPDRTRPDEMRTRTGSRARAGQKI
jgi:hypothetical protein